MSKKEDISIASLKSFSTANMEAALGRCMSVEQDLVKLRNYCFAAQFIKFFDKNPTALIYIHGRTGDYDDEGLEGCFVSRVDKEYVRKTAKKLLEKNSERPNRRFAEDATYDKDARDFVNGNWESRDNLPRNLTAYEVSDFAPFVIAAETSKSMGDTWQNISNFDNDSPSASGLVYDKNGLSKLLSIMDVNYGELAAKMEAEKLAKDAKISLKRKVKVGGAL